MADFPHPKCPVCGAPLHYGITIFGNRKTVPPCKNWVCSRNFHPPSESMVKSARQFLRWWKKIEPTDKPIPPSKA